MKTKVSVLAAEVNINADGITPTNLVSFVTIWYLMILVAHLVVLE